MRSVPLHLSELLKQLPKQPGVYRMWDKHGKLLYVGKAKNLKNRVNSYFQDQRNHTPRIRSMVGRIQKIDTIVTVTEMEALLLESNLIKAHRPKYNILLKDDSRYPWLAFTNEPFPRLVVTRHPNQAWIKKLFGPYPTVGAMYQTLKTIKKLFPLRQRRKPLFKTRPCMNYYIGQCLGPCQQLITEADYQILVEQVTLFLKGRTKHVLKQLTTQMEVASEAMQFELAAKLRDRIVGVQKATELQRVISDDEGLNEDVLGYVQELAQATVSLLRVRQGKLVQTMFYEVLLPTEVTHAEVMQAILLQIYQNQGMDVEDFPTTWVLPHLPNDSELIETWLRQQTDQNIQLVTPDRANKHQKSLLTMAEENAKEAIHRNQVEAMSQHALDPIRALIQLQEALGLPQLPGRMECYDISHVSGTHTVASMVVFMDGLPDKKSYRRFKITTTEEGVPNDFLSMQEVIRRRFQPKNLAAWPEPDLVIIDGGKGQLSSALEALTTLGLTEQPVISLAKKFEEIYLPHRPRPVVLERTSGALRLLKQIRDEAHRFAITFHRQLRGKAQTKSFLDEIPGIGKVRKDRLFKTLETVEAILAASVEDIGHITQTTGQTAQKLYDALHQYDPVDELGG